MRTALNSSVANDKIDKYDIKCCKTSSIFYVVRREKHEVRVGIPARADKAQAARFIELLTEGSVTLLRAGWKIRRNSEGFEFWLPPEDLNSLDVLESRSPGAFWSLSVILPIALVVVLGAVIIASI